MELRSLGHSKKVSLLFFPETMVIGPFVSTRFWRVYRFTRDLINVVFPTWELKKRRKTN